MAPKVAIITVLYNNETDLPEYFQSLGRVCYPSDAIKLYIYDNASKDDSVAVSKQLIPSLPFECELTAASDNTGFTGGNNRAYLKARESDYVFLLNPDTEIEPDCIEILVKALEADTRIGAAQPLLLTLPDKNKINTTGNLCHYLGFGMVRDNGRDRAELSLTETRSIVGVTGAAFFLRTNVLEKGESLFEESFFAYHEDFELSWRIRLKGYALCMIPQAVVYHRYAFGKGTFKFYLLERNRAHVLLTHYSSRTLFILTPLIVITEALVFAQSILGGWMGEKIRAWRDTTSNLPTILEKRKRIQHMRTVSDRDLFVGMHDSLEFPEKTPLPVTLFYNPLSRIYKLLVSSLI